MRYVRYAVWETITW